MKKYDKYKITKNVWFPELPIHWILTKVKYISHTIAGGTPSTDRLDFWDNGNIPWLPSGKLQNCDITTAEKFITEEGLNNSSTKWIKPNTTLIALTGATCANIGYLRFKACANQSVIAIDEFRDKADSRFLFYMFIDMRKQILTHQSGGAQAGINDGNVKNLFLTIPYLNEQTKIAQYLDHQTAIIDQLIQQKEKLIALLKEKRQAIINEAVTKGLNPNAKMKDSGVEWLGEVPEHWVFKKLSYNTYMKGRIGWQGLRQDEFIETGPYLITGMNFKDGKIRWDEVYHISQERYEEAPEIQLREGDVLMTKDGTIGKLLFIDYLPGPTSLNSHLLVLRPTDNSYIPKFLYYQLMSQLFLEHVELNKTGTTFYGITQEAMGRYKMLLPALSEQKAIVFYIEESIRKIEELSNKLLIQIDRLKEYRQSLISEAVTGKIDLRDWKLSEPQMNAD
ncbi:MAG: restriction endonuclease subunit S [Deltaproteobacteria bacterium]